MVPCGPTAELSAAKYEYVKVTILLYERVLARIRVKLEVLLVNCPCFPSRGKQSSRSKRPARPRDKLTIQGGNIVIKCHRPFARNKGKSGTLLVQYVLRV